MSDEPNLELFVGEGDEAPAPPAPPRPKVWSVSQVNRAVRGLLESSVDPLWVGGEVVGWNRSRAGHCYFGLKDERAQIRCVIFSREASLLPADPEEGMQVRVFGELTLYEAKGEYQLVARRVEAEGAEGLWRLAFEKLRAKLEAEGLLAPERKRRLPRAPACVGVVTSRDGAAIRDILSVVARRAPWTRVVLRNTRVQGEGASLEIARALEDLAASGMCEVIIVGRGGGAIEDLWAFNEEPVARAIAACPVPVISAVGHEVDVTISDLVADLRAPTPSAAAEAVVPDGAVVLETIRRASARFARALTGAVERRRSAVDQRGRRLERAIERRFVPARQAVDRATGRLERCAVTRVERARAALSGLGGRLDALSPLSTLRRGYAVARSEDGRVLGAAADLPPGVRFRLRLADGTIAAESLGSVDHG
ncbi:MAG: exodeoxyribonuclease VII large subunit [Gemmatimonadales bacterium]